MTAVTRLACIKRRRKTSTGRNTYKIQNCGPVSSEATQYLFGIVETQGNVSHISASIYCNLNTKRKVIEAADLFKKDS